MDFEKYEAVLLKNDIEIKEIERDMSILNKKREEMLEHINIEKEKLFNINNLLKQKNIPSILLKSNFNYEKKNRLDKSLIKIEESLKALNNELKISNEKRELIFDLIKEEKQKEEKKKNKKEEQDFIEFKKNRNKKLI